MKKENRKEAVALSFNSEQSEAPKVIAKGKGLVADSILNKAQESGVPIQEDPNLVQLLGQLNLNESIPEELYQAVAEVFAFIYKLDQINGKNK
ncbi:flhB HrpN YscU SpaS family protein [Kurthia sp. 11kri321]|uniref:EscU/YscU/HrcU family type III secretion system export apparatus switch protein n=1 Tax=Kurthia TaxID=1649 RepID=UPI000745C784|nr:MULTISPECIES: EscU/YscU/HrcU family type III secretion system export apparatus switch protein [Kurthia]AMA61878.1 flhB HrpN YscU SpaS family protein [Kurthia sp. 11kri321]MEB6111749.1 EscU/YscU/HrcU family type III secretion system export apparatus switch protein [Kurthia gibsonii]